MSSKEAQRMLADVFKALGHPIRLGIVLMLREGERCVCEMVEQLGGGQQSNVSQHLAVLRAAGILDSRKEGLSVYYRLRYSEVLELVCCAEKLLFKQMQVGNAALRPDGE